MSVLDLFKLKHSFVSAEVLKGKTDRHSHILFGVDDGLRTLEESLDLLKFMEAQGITDVWCTPHIIEDGINDHDLFKANFEQLCQAYSGPIKLHLAAEYMLDTVFEQRFRDRSLLTHANNTLLVETSTWTPPVGLHKTLREIQNAGYRPLLAHPERYRYMNKPSYERLRKLGIHFQLNLPSLVGFYGETAQGKTEWLLEQGFYTEVGSDCHRLHLIKEQYERTVLKKETIAQLSKLVITISKGQ